MKTTYLKLTDIAGKAKDTSLLLLRLILAYGFFKPALMKWQDINGIAEWFASMDYPLPLLNAYMAASTEMLLAILLPFGLFTRLISVPGMITMVVAITTVHLNNGFEASANGFEIPLYYLLMLFVLFTHGPGRYSMDNLWLEKRGKQNI